MVIRVGNIFECLSCDEKLDIDTEDMPDNACDVVDFECPHCHQEMTLGWVSLVEVRSLTVSQGDLDYSLLEGN